MKPHTFKKLWQCNAESALAYAHSMNQTSEHEPIIEALYDSNVKEKQQHNEAMTKQLLDYLYHVTEIAKNEMATTKNPLVSYDILYQKMNAIRIAQPKQEHPLHERMLAHDTLVEEPAHRRMANLEQKTSDELLKLCSPTEFDTISDEHQHAIIKQLLTKHPISIAKQPKQDIAQNAYQLYMDTRWYVLIDYLINNVNIAYPHEHFQHMFKDMPHGNHQPFRNQPNRIKAMSKLRNQINTLNEPIKQLLHYMLEPNQDEQHNIKQQIQKNTRSCIDAMYEKETLYGEPLTNVIAFISKIVHEYKEQDTTRQVNRDIPQLHVYEIVMEKQNMDVEQLRAPQTYDTNTVQKKRMRIYIDLLAKSNDTDDINWYNTFIRTIVKYHAFNKDTHDALIDIYRGENITNLFQHLCECAYTHNLPCHTFTHPPKGWTPMHTDCSTSAYDNNQPNHRLHQIILYTKHPRYLTKSRYQPTLTKLANIIETIIETDIDPSRIRIHEANDEHVQNDIIRAFLYERKYPKIISMVMHVKYKTNIHMSLNEQVQWCYTNAHEMDIILMELAKLRNIN